MVKFFLKPGKSLYTRIFRSAVLCAGISCLSATGAHAEDPQKERSGIVGLRGTAIGALVPPPTGNYMYEPDTTLKGILKRDLLVSGTVRFLTIYRNMQDSYQDMVTSDRNISFLDYPLANVGTASTGGFPILEINLQSKLTTNFKFNVGYSFGHAFTGVTETDAARNISSRQNLYFSGLLTSDVVNFNINAGTVLWTSISRMTMGQPAYRDNYFERLPWDWYRQSFTRFDEYYSLSTNLGAEGFGRSPVSGFVGTLDFFKAGVTVSSVFGRTNRSLVQANTTAHFPSYTYAGRIEKSIFSRYIDGKFGINYYIRKAYTTRASEIADMNSILSVDGRMRWKKILFATELGMGKIDNPNINPGNDFKTGEASGIAATFKVEFDRKISPVPFGVEVYSVNYNVVSLDGGILNSNVAIEDGGVINEFLYDNMMMLNVLQEVGQLANNRMGAFINAEAKVEKLKIQLGLGISQELENLHDTITIQHKVNAFSRSRFRPWFQAGGPYGRIKSGWRRTFETMTITDAGTNHDYKKGFNTVELLLKYKTFIFGRDLVLLNFQNWNSIQEGLSPIPSFGASDKTFVRQYFTDLTVAYKIGKKYAISGYAGLEKVWGGQRTDLADANGQLIKGADGKPTFDATGKPMDQTGWGFGAGIDYDFSPTAGLHLRHTWMTHKDASFARDTFKGQETTFELKIFF